MSVWSTGSLGLTWLAAAHAASRRQFGILGRLWAGTARPRPWGEDLIEQSLSTLLYPSRWDEVGHDELVFLLPSLHRGGGASQPSGAAAAFHDARAEWMQHAVNWSDPTAARRVLDVLEMLHRLASGDTTCRMPTTAEAMTGAIHARVNAAYADARLDYLHEPLMVAAWLGHLVAGRDALLPPLIAAPIASLIAGGLSATAQHPDPAATVVVRYAAAAGGTRHLARIAAKVCRAGRPRLVRSTVLSPPFIPPCPWARPQGWTLRARRTIPARASCSGE